MQTVRSLAELKEAVARLRSHGGSLALVPTMGALHAGHVALVDEARRRADHVVASIFVNPLQFGANEDLDRYPRREEEDAAMLEQAGCALLWVPTRDEIYPPAFATSVSVRSLGGRWEGEARPCHFDGVATVVAKLLVAVGPDMALFGEKDFQQLAVIRRMVADLALPVEIVGLPTVRDEDGLALSSRNAYLSANERASAVALPQSLERARDAIAGGEPVSRALDRAKQELRDAGFSRIDYVALVDSETLEPVDAPAMNLRLIAAATIGSTRLIDNIPFATDAIPGR